MSLIQFFNHVVITGEQEEEDEFDIEYHNFDGDPLCGEGGATAQAATPDSPKYKGPSLSGPREQTSQSRRSAFLHSSSDFDDKDSSALAPLQYALISVNQEEISGSSTTATKGSANQSQQQDGTFEL